MPALVNYSGNDDLYKRIVYMDSSRLFHLPPNKRARVTPPFSLTKSLSEKRPSLDSLPNECLFEIFRKLEPQPRSLSACVSKRWLMILSSIRSSEIQSKADVSDDDEMGNEGFLSRCLKGKKANDVNLASVAVGTISRGGLGKLSIRANNLTRGLTNVGLKAIARGCPSLKALSMWDVSTIGDEGLFEVAKECRLLKKLDFTRCGLISDKGLIEIARSSPNLRDLTIDSCPNIGNESLRAFAKWCPKLQNVCIKDSSAIDDQGITALFQSPRCVLSNLNLENLCVTDLSLAVIGHYGNSLTCLKLTGLQLVGEKGFWVMGNAKGLNKLSSLEITSSRGVTDLSLEAIVKGCPSLKNACFRKCCFVSDYGFTSFAQGATSLETLSLEECNRVTLLGLLGTLSVSKSNFKSLSIIKCLGIKDLEVEISSLSTCESLRCLAIKKCPGFGNASLAIIGKLCPNLTKIDFSGDCKITDAGLLPLIETFDGLVKVDLSYCSNLTDDVASSIARNHFGTLEYLSLDGCFRVTDASLAAIAEHCLVLEELYVSKCSITDLGIAYLAREEQINLLTLSVCGCTKISEKSVASLLKLGESLKGLNIKNCNSLSFSVIMNLLGSLWRCDILY